MIYLVLWLEELNSFVVDPNDDLSGEVSVSDALTRRIECGSVVAPFFDDAEILGFGIFRNSPLKGCVFPKNQGFPLWRSFGGETGLWNKVCNIWAEKGQAVG